MIFFQAEAAAQSQSPVSGGGLGAVGKRSDTLDGKNNGQISPNMSPLSRPTELRIPCPASPSHQATSQGARGDDTQEGGQSTKKTNTFNGHNVPNVNFEDNSRGGLANIPESGESVL